MNLNFLQLVQRAYRESGVAGSTGPASVLSQTGRNNDFVNWVLTAYEEIQNLRDSWNFLWRQGTFDLTAGNPDYTPSTDFAITGGVSAWVRDGAYVYLASQGVTSRTFLSYLEWPQFRTLPLQAAGRPVYFTEKPDGTVSYYPDPDVAYKAVHEYWLVPQTLAADADVPILPPRFHMAIVWKSVMLYAEFNKDWSLLDAAETKYDAIMDRVLGDQQMDLMGAGPLA